MEEIDFAVKYPFTRIAKEILIKNNVEISEQIVELAIERIKTALSTGAIPKSSAIHFSQKIEEIASYAAARMILGFMKNTYLTNRYSIAEAKKTNAYLGSENETEVEKLGSEFEITSSKVGKKVVVPLHTYLKFAPRGDNPYRLINRDVFNGFVTIEITDKKNELNRLIEEAVKKHVEKIPFVKDSNDMIKNASERIKESLPKMIQPEFNVKLEDLDNPPCIEKLLEAIKKHENLGHQARWYLAVYLLNLKTNMEQIVSIYSNLPDYNEKITRYQLEHAKSKQYVTPSCASVMSYGLCCANCKIGNPMNWHKLRKEDKNKVKENGGR